MTITLIGSGKCCGAHGGTATLEELTSELGLKTGIGEVGVESKGRVFQEEGRA